MADLKLVKTEKDPEQEALQQRRLDALKQLPSYRGSISSKTQLRQLSHTTGVAVGEIFYVENEEKAYIIAEKDKDKLTLKALDETATLSTGMTIFDVNKNAVSKEPIFDFENESAVRQLKESIWDFFNEQTHDTYYLLYGRDIHYVSLIQVENRAKGDNAFEVSLYEYKELIAAISNIGNLISMDFNTEEGKEKSIEIWVRSPFSKADLLYLMPFDRGLIKI